MRQVARYILCRLRGDRGVELVPTRGDRLFVGSKNQSALDAAIERVAANK